MLFKLIACMIILGLIILNIIYKRQIKSIYRQIDFINEHETNKIIVRNVSFQEIDILVDRLNDLIKIHRDITKEYKVKDDALKQAITDISHDIRTPLTSLNGYFQLLLQSDSEEEKARYITIIQTRIDNLKNLLEDMFTYMKIQDDSYKLDEENCNLTKIIQDNLLSYYKNFRSREIEPIINIPESPIIVRSNILASNRIISNLINNSLIHGKSHIGVTLFEEDGLVNFIIKNDVENGEDIDLENIFTRFYKNDKARTVNSTGLGLTIVKDLVESMGGKITANIDDNMFAIHIILA